MNVSRITVSMAAVAILAGGVALWPANAQPAGGGGGGQPPAQPGGGGGRGQPRGDRPAGGGGGSKWRETYQTELQEHPSLARALVALHDAKDYLEQAKDDLGGHKATAMKACDDSIKELTETIKFDPKREAPAGRGRPGDAKPGDSKPATPQAGKP